MTEHIKIAAKIPRKRYVADGTQAVFSFDFVLFQPSELLVTVNGAPVASGVGVSLLADGTGTATFAAAPAAGAVVVLLRRVTIKRETDFQEGGELRAKTLNDEFDFQTAALQQVETAAARALQLPIDDADNAATVLPIAAVRATKMLAFDASGNPTLSNQTLAQIEAGSNAAAASAANAASSAAASEASATAAQNSATNAGAQATNAANSATAAAASAASLVLPLPLASGGTGAATAAAARTNLGLEIGTGAGNVVALDGSARLPAIDGSLLTNVAGASTQVTAGEALAIRDLIYQDIFNQRGGGADRWYRVDTDATGPVRISPRVAIALAAIASGASGSAQVRAGRVPGFTGLTAGQPVFASTTAGAITQTVPAVPSTGTQNATRLIGYAASTTEIDFDPDDDTTFTARNSALASGSALVVEHFSDGGGRERLAAAYLVGAAPVQTQIAQGTGTALGDMTANGGLAAAFDGNLSQADASSAGTASVSVTVGYVGKDWGDGDAKTVTGFRVYGPNNQFIGCSSGTVTITLFGSTDNFSSSNVNLGNIAAADGNAAVVISKLSGLTTTAYRYHRLEIAAPANSGSGNRIRAAEVQFFEDTLSYDEPIGPVPESLNSAATNAVTARFADAANANADRFTTFRNRTGAARDLAAEVIL